MKPDITLQKLTPKQKKAIPLLASGMSGKNVASEINCNPATVSQWINHDINFQVALDSFSDAGLKVARLKLESLATQAVNSLQDLLADAESEQVRLKAIELVLATLAIGSSQKFQPAKVRTLQTLSVSDSGRYDFNKLVEALVGE